MQKTVGGDRLGSGPKQRVELKNYERSTHDLSYIWRSTMSPGVLIPFMSELALPGDTFDIKLDANVMTHPTLGPLFGSFKLQLDVFEAPIRLYHSALHNNTLGIGNQMQTVLLPKLLADPLAAISDITDIDNVQINPSCILSYLGIRGWGFTADADTTPRKFNAIPFLAYWEIYKNYYANKQEPYAWYIQPPTPTAETITGITIDGITLNKAPNEAPIVVGPSSTINVLFSGTQPDLTQILVYVPAIGNKIPITEIAIFQLLSPGVLQNIDVKLPDTELTYWDYAETNTTLAIAQFALENIDFVRQEILASNSVSEYVIDSASWLPYRVPMTTAAAGSQCGLGLKTYQSDLLNNWIQTEWLDGSQGINTITAIDTSSGSFQIDSLILSRKIYDMLNRIAISGGSYDDWLDAVYAHERYTRCESPMYHGGLSKEVIFQQVVSLAEANAQPLGTLGGRGALSHKHKGGTVVIKVNEPSYIMGIVSLTPRLDYSQGNKWDTHLQNMNDLHKPALDEIGFQELITEQMAWWDTHWNGTAWITKSAGKQPAWTNYMTNINRCYGNFAIATNEMFMTLNRRYTIDKTTLQIADVTTYIDPSKFNFIFAQTSLDAQNFWTQIAVDITARRKMSAKIMPNL